jgi:hypothetical protein
MIAVKLVQRHAGLGGVKGREGGGAERIVGWGIRTCAPACERGVTMRYCGGRHCERLEFKSFKNFAAVVDVASFVVVNRFELSRRPHHGDLLVPTVRYRYCTHYSTPVVPMLPCKQSGHG